MKKMILLSVFAMSAQAASLSPVTTPYKFEEAPEYQAILAHLKTYGEFAQKTPQTKPEETTPAPKPMSRGQQAVEEAKAKNRAILAERNKKDKEAPATDMTELEKWKKEEKDTLNSWKKESQDQLNQWKKEQDIFLGKIKVYQENTFTIPVKKEVIVEKKVEPNLLPDVFIVNGTFQVPVRDQYSRATCSAFAGVRALEILLAQHNNQKDLSEQYFYWASKPKCHTSPCTEKGSWVNAALNYSKGMPTVDIPSESNCAYQGSADEKNETQVPLQANCKMGQVKVEAYGDVRTLADVVEKLKTNTPVIMAAKLSPNFYKNSGLVTLADSTKDVGIKLDGHSLGHAFLGVGVMELPEKLKATEGSYCIVVANSWGKGWGAGGYSCLTEKWLTKFRQPAPFVAVNKISI